MATHLESKLKKLGLFAMDKGTALPISRMPFYAEVGVRSTLAPPPTLLDERFEDAMKGALNSADQECAVNEQCWSSISDILRESFSRLISTDTRDKLAADNA